MQLLSIAITLVVVVLVSAMILKKYKPHAILLGGGIVLLLSAQFLGINNIITDVEKSTGFWLFDVFECVQRCKRMRELPEWSSWLPAPMQCS